MCLHAFRWKNIANLPQYLSESPTYVVFRVKIKRGVDATLFLLLFRFKYTSKIYFAKWNNFLANPLVTERKYKNNEIGALER